jgi:hypothetical protein
MCAGHLDQLSVIIKKSRTSNYMTNFLRGTYIVVVEKYLMKQVFGSLKGLPNDEPIPAPKNSDSSGSLVT